MRPLMRAARCSSSRGSVPPGPWTPRPPPGPTPPRPDQTSPCQSPSCEIDFIVSSLWSSLLLSFELLSDELIDEGRVAIKLGLVGTGVDFKQRLTGVRRPSLKRIFSGIRRLGLEFRPSPRPPFGL